MATRESGLTSHIEKMELPISKDVPDIYKDLDNLSPTTKESLSILLRSISKGEAQIDIDADGKPQVEYKQAKKLQWDGSNANLITEPKTDPDINAKVDACLELIGYFKSEKPPSGVNLDKTKISLSSFKKQYREGPEFTKTKRILGSGNSAGDIIVVKDTKTHTEHAHKTMMISVFRKEEIRCWVDLSDTGYVPCLYMFNIEGNKISIHMEILEHAKTLSSIIDEHMASFTKEDEYGHARNQALVKPFSLYVLDGALQAVTSMHGKNWVHKDLHGGNVMLQRTGEDMMQVKVLDFGMAGHLDGGPNGLDLRGFQSDIAEVVRLFSGLYTGQEFDNVWDIQHNWRQKLSEITATMSTNDREELFCLVDGAMKVLTPADVEQYRALVKQKYNQALQQSHGEKNLLRRVAAILFPEACNKDNRTETFKDIHKVSTKSMDVVDCSHGNLDVADSMAHDRHDYQDYQDSANQNPDELTQNVTDEYLDNLRLSLSVSPY